MGVNTAVSKNARTRQNLRISARQFSRTEHVLVWGGRELRGRQEEGRGEILKRFREERNRRRMIL